MSTTFIISVVSAGLFLLIAIAAVMQTIEKNNKEKRRIEGALNARARNFEYMLQGFPKGFLNKDLQILVCKCIEEVFSQLLQANSKNHNYQNQLDKIRLKILDYNKMPSSSTAVTLTNAQQIKDVQKMLDNLYNFISKLAASGRVTVEQSKVYGKQVRRLSLQASLDSLNGPINDALARGKLQLAIHYLDIAQEKLAKENDDGYYTDRINQFKAQISDLNLQIGEQQSSAQTPNNDTDDQWDELNKPDDSWKKKAIYD